MEYKTHRAKGRGSAPNHTTRTKTDELKTNPHLLLKARLRALAAQELAKHGLPIHE